MFLNHRHGWFVYGTLYVVIRRCLRRPTSVSSGGFYGQPHYCM